MAEIRCARFPVDCAAVVEIFREYIGSTTVSLEFQDYEAELASLPGKYAAPDGGVLLAWRDGQVIGCAGFRKVDANTCELKRVYVRPNGRGERIGRHLVERILAETKQAGYARICLDVLPEFVAAQQLYESLGFTPADSVTLNPVPDTKFLGLDL